MKMNLKKILLFTTLPFALTVLSGCENAKGIGNQMLTGAQTYYYAYVKSQVTGNTYYHISGWKEYGPEGGVAENATIAPYVGLELQLAVSKDVIYYYEPGLRYVLTKNYNPAFGTAIE